jgi:competence protein ComEA
VRFFSKDQQAILLLLGLAVFFIALSNSLGSSLSTPRSPSSHLAEPRPQWIVEVAGAVRDPGIYIFDKPPTIYQAIQGAHGSICGHRFSLITPCDVLDTGVRLDLHVSGGGCSGVIITSMDSRKRLVLGIPIALNEARVEDLAMIPGISQGLSHRIIKFRESHGPFKTWNDLERVKGIGPKRMEKFRSYLSLTQTSRNQE